jgi:hypothetical protein
MKKETTEQSRLTEARLDKIPWRKWGPYLSERQWGTVREDYSENGDAWNYFTHDQARSRAYHWGEDGLAGFSDEKQRLCFALALWNGKDAILKERLFGLSNGEGNHGEDVKEYYFYLDSTPTHSYMKYLYKYPQQAYPYTRLIEENRKRTRNDFEYELIETGIFDEDRYFDVFVEYAKATPEEILIKISVYNRGPETADLHVLPTLWFRNTWTWWPDEEKPYLQEIERTKMARVIAVTHPQLGTRFLYCEGQAPLLFTENETNNARLFGGVNAGRYVKDGINDYLVEGRKEAVNLLQAGTKACSHYHIKVAPGKKGVMRLRLCDPLATAWRNPFEDFDDVMDGRAREANEFYRSIIPAALSEDQTRVMRQALAGMLWSKQHYFFDLDKWLEERSAHPLQLGTRDVRNREWFHMVNDHIISMPDKWEYPWYAAWDLAFHAITLSVVDLEFAKEQLEIMLKEVYLHPNGQVPAYEWNFSDVNPPVHAWATLYLHRIEQALHGEVDVSFLKRSFSKLALNFTWWVNRKDRFGKNVFEGGFLGLDNIGVFDRSAPLPTGGCLEQADGTAWMALFCQNMAALAVELAAYDASYSDMVAKFVEHFLWIATSVNRVGHEGMWDEEDGFYYDVLRFPDGTATRLKVRSMVGLLPLCATSATEKWQREQVPEAMAHLAERVKQMPELAQAMHPTGPGHYGVAERGIIALVNADRLRRILSKMLDENEFLSPYGIRALSRCHEKQPYGFQAGGQEYRVDYLPAESNTGMFGGNSNWRGPVWLPVNVLIIRALGEFYLYYGDSFKVECPTGSGRMMNLYEVAAELIQRLSAIFLRDEQGRRPVYGGAEKFQTDPHWKDYLLFYEYFHGDNGAGLGASHQTGWTGLIAKLLQIHGKIDAKTFLKVGNKGPARQKAAEHREEVKV